MSKHPIGTVTVSFMEIVSPSFSSCENDEGYTGKKNVYPFTQSSNEKKSNYKIFLILTLSILTNIPAGKFSL